MRRLPALLLLPVLVVAACTSSPSPAAEGPGAAGRTPETSPAAAGAGAASGEELVLQSFDGETVRLSDFRGRAVLLNAWAGWCPFCIAEMPDLQRAAQSFGDRAVVLFVHRTATEPQATGERFVRELEAKGSPPFDRGRLLLDPGDTFYKTHFGFGMPVSLFVGPDGQIADKKIGSMDEDEARERLEKVLGS